MTSSPASLMNVKEHRYVVNYCKYYIPGCFLPQLLHVTAFQLAILALVVSPRGRVHYHALIAIGKNQSLYFPHV